MKMRAVTDISSDLHKRLCHLPGTSSELIETSGTTQSYCYPLPFPDVAKRVDALLNHCYGPVEGAAPISKTVYVPVHADFEVLSESLPNGVR